MTPPFKHYQFHRPERPRSIQIDPRGTVSYAPRNRPRDERPGTRLERVSTGEHGARVRPPVETFLLGDGVEAPDLEHEQFNPHGLMLKYVQNDGNFAWAPVSILET